MRTHPVNVSYLVVGLVFLGISGSWLLRETGVIDLGEVRWLFPLTLVAAGAIGLAAVAARSLSRSRRADSAQSPETFGSTDDLHLDTHDYEGEAR